MRAGPGLAEDDELRLGGAEVNPQTVPHPRADDLHLRPLRQRGTNRQRIVERAQQVDPPKRRCARQGARSRARRDDQAVVRDGGRVVEQQPLLGDVESDRPPPQPQVELELGVVLAAERQPVDVPAAGEDLL